MRTTVEITDEQRDALNALASRRGLRGYSTLVQEAIDLYLAAHEHERIEAALALRGSITEAEAEEMRRKIAEAWATWPDPSS